MFPISPELIHRVRVLYSHLMKLENVMAEKTLNDLFYDTLKDIYFAEKALADIRSGRTKPIRLEKLMRRYGQER